MGQIDIKQVNTNKYIVTNCDTFQEGKEQRPLMEHNKEKLQFHGMTGDCISKAMTFDLNTKGPVESSKEKNWEQAFRKRERHVRSP